MAPQIWFTGMNPPGRERISGAVGARGLPLPVRLGGDCLPPPGGHGSEKSAPPGWIKAPLTAKGEFSVVYSFVSLNSDMHRK